MNDPRHRTRQKTEHPDKGLRRGLRSGLPARLADGALPCLPRVFAGPLPRRSRAFAIPMPQYLRNLSNRIRTTQRQTERQRHRDKETQIQIHRYTDPQIHRRIYPQTNRYTDTQVHRCTETRARTQWARHCRPHIMRPPRARNERPRQHTGHLAVKHPQAMHSIYVVGNTLHTRHIYGRGLLVDVLPCVGRAWTHMRIKHVHI